MADFRHGLVLGKFYPLHAGHQALIRRALRECAGVTVEVLGSTVETIPLHVRADWIRQEHPTARVRAAFDEAAVDFTSVAAWDAHMPVITALLDSPVDAVFTCDDYGAELARRLGATWRRVDAGRVANPVSGTAIRADVAGYWHELPAPVREYFTRRMVLLGAEATGTTTLAGALATALGARWVPEYGRTHSRLRDGGLAAPWRTDEFDVILDRQRDLERAAARETPSPLVVCDTDALATMVWHERYVGPAPRRMWRRALVHPPLGYILTGDEIPFVQDGLRDGEHLRGDMQQRFREVLAGQPVPWIEVHGDPGVRLATALAFVHDRMRGALAVGPSLEELGTR